MAAATDGARAGDISAALSEGGSKDTDAVDKETNEPTVQQRMAAAAVIEEKSLPTLMAWLGLAVLTQLSWGLYGVCTRYLQTTSAYTIPTLQLIVALNLIAWPGLIMFCTVPNMVILWWEKRAARLAAAAATEAGEGGAGAEADVEVPAEQLPRRQRLKAWWSTYWRQTLLATSIGLLVSLQALSQIYASKFANAYLAQLIFMFTPVFAALANRWLLKQPSPRFLWPTIVLMLGGSAMVVVGQLMQNSESSNSGSTTSTGDLILGMGLALVSTLLLTAYLVVIQITRHLVSGEAVLWGKRNVAVVLFVPLSLIVDGTDWSWVVHLSAAAWGVLIFTGLYIYTLMNMTLQFCTRALGATLLSIFLSLRLVSSIVGSIVLLHETPTKALTWVGLVLIVVVSAAFLSSQYYFSSRAKAAAAAAVVAEADVADATAPGEQPGVELAPRHGGGVQSMRSGQVQSYASKSSMVTAASSIIKNFEYCEDGFPVDMREPEELRSSSRRLSSRRLS